MDKLQIIQVHIAKLNMFHQLQHVILLLQLLQREVNVSHAHMDKLQIIQGHIAKLYMFHQL